MLLVPRLHSRFHYRSEMRVVHELSKILQRDVLLGATSLETPESFVDTLRKLNMSA
jgi:hypothetical protein